MTKLREPTSDVQREAPVGGGNDLGRKEYEQDLLEIAKRLHQNVDAVDPIIRDQKDRKHLSNLSGALAKSNMVLTWGLVASVALNGMLGWFAVHPDRRSSRCAPWRGVDHQTSRNRRWDRGACRGSSARPPPLGGAAGTRQTQWNGPQLMRQGHGGRQPHELQ